jgi:hypothetical protein
MIRFLYVLRIIIAARRGKSSVCVILRIIYSGRVSRSGLLARRIKHPVVRAINWTVMRSPSRAPPSRSIQTAVRVIHRLKRRASAAEAVLHGVTIPPLAAQAMPPTVMEPLRGERRCRSLADLLHGRRSGGPAPRGEGARGAMSGPQTHRRAQRSSMGCPCRSPRPRGVVHAHGITAPETTVRELRPACSMGLPCEGRAPRGYAILNAAMYGP